MRDEGWKDPGSYLYVCAGGSVEAVTNGTQADGLCTKRTFCPLFPSSHSGVQLRWAHRLKVCVPQAVTMAALLRGHYLRSILRCAQLARFLYIGGNLLPERLDAFKFFLRPKELHEFDFDIGAVDVAMEIEEMHFDHPLGCVAGNGGPESDIDDTVMQHAFQPGFDEVNTVGRKLFAVRAEICSGKTKLPSQLRPFPDRTQNGVIAAEHRGRTRKIAPLNAGANRSTANDRSIHFHRGNSDNIKLVPRPELAQKGEIAGAIFSEGPFVTNTNLTQRFGALGQLGDEIFGFRPRKILVERNDQEVTNAERAGEGDLMRC